VQWWTGEVFEGPAHVLAFAPLGRPAVYVRGNAAIPLWPARRHTGEPVERMTLRVFPAGDEVVTRSVYEDAGDGYGPASRFSVSVDGPVVRVSARDGEYVPPYALSVEAGADVFEVASLPAEITLR
jgi:alpha-glucosidase